MNAYARERTAFGQPLANYGQIQRHIAESYAEYQAAKAYTYNLAAGALFARAHCVDARVHCGTCVCAGLDLNSVGNRIDSDGVKLFSTTMAKNVADRAIQVRGSGCGLRCMHGALHSCHYGCYVQVLGGYGYCGPYRVEQLWRDSKLLEIGGGTLEAHHKNMTRDLSRFPKLP